MFIYDFDKQEETLAFDFNLSEGDHFTTFNGKKWEIVDIRNVLLKINRAGRTLIDTGEGLYLVDHTDKEGIIKRKEGQEGFQCVAKIGTEGLCKREIEELKKEITDEIIRDKTGISGVLESHGYSERLQNSDSIDAEVRRSNADNVGLDQETPQGESLGEPSNSDSQEDFGADFIRVRDSDGTNSKRVVPRDFFSKNDSIPYYLLKTPKGEVEIYGFIDPETLDMYLDDATINPEHPIHEYTHLWDRALYGMDPDHKILRVEEVVSVQNRI
jgi:hypothetical protein